MIGRRIEIGAVIALVVAVSGGLFWLGQMSESIKRVDERVGKIEIDPQIKKMKEDLIEHIEKKSEELRSTDFSSYSKLPVGSIIPFAGKLDQLRSLSDWKLCDGGILVGEEYKDSPFYNRKLPLLDKLFLRATLSSDKIFEIDGEDSVKHDHEQPHTHDLSHKHTGTTELGIPVNAPKADDHTQGGNHYHTFTTSTQDQITTTQPSVIRTKEVLITTVPRHMNVHYIIKVK